MSEGSSAVFWYFVPIVALNLGYAIYTWRQSDRVARKNREFIESGEEAYFEQRRSWNAYGTTPETDPALLKRKAFHIVVLNGIALLAVAVLWWVR